VEGVQRILLLSDGEANTGATTREEFRELGERCRIRGVAVSSIGVDSEYDEKLLAAVSVASNGRHHFAETPEHLAGIFDAELQELVTTLAKGAELRLSWAPGVRAREVFDRASLRMGEDTVVPLGTFAAGERKTVLVKVDVPTGSEGHIPIVRARLEFDDVSAGERAAVQGHLTAALSAVPSDVSPLDPLVEVRLQRAETASTLKYVNELMLSGNASEAERRLDHELGALDRRREAATRRGGGHVLAVDSDYALQREFLEHARQPPPQSAAAGPPRPAGPGRYAVQTRRNMVRAVDMGY
jgi:Ca-activated chloride channel family protein